MQTVTDLTTRLAEILGVKKDSQLFGLIEDGISYVPYVGKIIQTVKITRLERRVAEHQQNFFKINGLMSNTVLAAEYIKERIFPVVFEDLLEEHEDAKISYILHGFQNVILEEKSEESLVFNYFDTLRGLRYADIRRLYYYADLDDPFPSSNTTQEIDSFIRNIDKKLSNLGLVHLKVRIGDWNGEELPRKKDEIIISSYGCSFISFITPKE